MRAFLLLCQILPFNLFFNNDSRYSRHFKKNLHGNAELNLSSKATLGQTKVAVVERVKQQSMYGLSAKNIGRCGEVAVSGSSTVLAQLK